MTWRRVRAWASDHKAFVIGLSSFFLGIGIAVWALYTAAPRAAWWQWALFSVGLLTTIGGPVGLLRSFEKQLKSLERAVRENVLPRTIAEQANTNLPLFPVLREVVSGYLRAQDYGDYPIMERSHRKWVVSILSPEQYKDFGVPGDLPDGYRAVWLHARVTEQWQLRPLYDGRERVLDPRAYLPPLTVLTYSAYAWELPEHLTPTEFGGLFFPLGGPLTEHPKLVGALRGVQYLRGKGGRGGLNSHVSLRSDTRIEAEATIPLIPCYGRQSQRRKRKDLERRLPGLRKRPRQLDRACEAVLQIYEPQYTSDLADLRISVPDLAATWSYHTEFEYVLPVHVTQGGQHVSTLNHFIIPFSRATKLQRFSFRTVEQSGLRFSWSHRAIVNATINSERPGPCLDPSRLAWTWEPGDHAPCLLPGDTIVFSWEWDPEVLSGPGPASRLTHELGSGNERGPRQGAS